MSVRGIKFTTIELAEERINPTCLFYAFRWCRFECTGFAVNSGFDVFLDSSGCLTRCSHKGLVPIPAIGRWSPVWQALILKVRNLEQLPRPAPSRPHHSF